MLTLEKPIFREIKSSPTERYITNRMTYLASPDETENQYSFIHVEFGRDGTLGAHIHAREDEVVYVLRGQATFQVADQEYKAEPRSLVYLPRGLAHEIVEHSSDFEALVLHTPGDYAQYFHLLGSVASSASMPTQDQIIGAGTRFGITYLPHGASVAGWPIPDVHADPKHVTLGDGERLEVLDSEVTIKLESSDTQGLFSMFEIEVPGESSSPYHVHHAESEAFFILEGAFEFRMGERIEKALPGSFVFIPVGLERSYRNYGRNKGRMLSITARAGLEKFYRQAAQMKTFDAERLSVVARRYGIDILESA